MNIQGVANFTLARSASGPRLEAGQTAEEFADQFRPTGAVAEPSPLPRFRAQESIESLATTLHGDWASRMGGQEKATIGILVERGWKPDGRHDEVLNIADAIMDSGGLPRLLFLGGGAPESQMAGLHGLAVPGGRDVDPSSYGMPMGPNMDPTEPDKAFDDFEIACIRQAFSTGMPLLGHCRGAQITNVAGGGTMTQDIPAEYVVPEGSGSKYGTPVPHRPESTRHDEAERVRPAHFVVAEPGSRLAAAVGELDAVNSIHHQCIAALSPMLVAVAFALDGLTEGFERKGMPWQHGYQFHPEAMRYSDGRYQGLYGQFVEDSARFKAGELFVPARDVPSGASFGEDAKAQTVWLKSQARQRFGCSPQDLMETRVGQAHFQGLAEEWRIAHPR